MVTAHPSVGSNVWDFYKMGIDMSHAFDTIQRHRILEVLHLAGCNDDDLQLMRLLAGTHLMVRVRSAQSALFETTLGSPQCDNLSLVLFTCYLAAALVAVRQKTTRPNPPISNRGMPLEWEYTDDVDFADEEREPLDAILSTACTELINWNLFVNEAKITNIHIFLTNTSETDSAGNMLRGNKK